MIYKIKEIKTGKVFFCTSNEFDKETHLIKESKDEHEKMTEKQNEYFNKKNKLKSVLNDEPNEKNYLEIIKALVSLSLPDESFNAIDDFESSDVKEADEIKIDDGKKMKAKK